VTSLRQAAARIARDEKRRSTLRCRFTAPSQNIWSRQCPHPAKGERRTRFDDPSSALPACGVHLNARYAYEYRRSPTSVREQPVAEFML
jgi:hypothetical protein